MVDPDGQHYPGAMRLATCLLTLPTHAYLTEADFARIFRVFDVMDSWESNGHARTATR
jgi:hypothetical protein